jgi:iron complex transport system substrate-binding protein
MKTLYYSTILTFSLFMLFGCGNYNETQSAYLPGDGCEYAKYFGLSDSAGNINIIVQDSWEEDNLTGEGILVIRKADNKEYSRIVCMSTSHIAYITALGLQDRIVGVSGSRYISTPEITEGIADGKIADIGSNLLSITNFSSPSGPT